MGEWVSAIAGAAGWQGRLMTVPEARLPEPLRASFDTSQHLVVSTERIRSELGYQEAVPRDEALRRTIQWERANPPGDVDPGEFDYTLVDDHLP